MTLSLPLGLLCFGVTYVGLSLLAAWRLPGAGWLASAWLNVLVVSAVAAGGAVVLGLSVGRLTPTATAICAFVIQVAGIATIIGLYVALSSRGQGTVVWPPLLGSALLRVWPSWLAGVVAGTVWPVVWLLVFRRVAPRLAPAVSG